VLIIMKDKIDKRLQELQQMQQRLAQQVILAERALEGLKQQLASVQGAIIELTALNQKPSD